MTNDWHTFVSHFLQSTLFSVSPKIGWPIYLIHIIIHTATIGSLNINVNINIGRISYFEWQQLMLSGVFCGEDRAIITDNNIKNTMQQ